jgi:hypothetical protein
MILSEPLPKRFELSRRKAADMESPNQSGRGVMSEPQPKDKGEEERQSKPKKPPGYRKFAKLLKQVVNAPLSGPTRKNRFDSDTAQT